jgi:hypothetical protein
MLVVLALLGVLVVLLMDDGAAPVPPPAATDRASHFRAVVGGLPVHLALEDCEVFVVSDDGGREKVLSTDFYPMLSACARQEAASDAEFITVELGRLALGAGACCTTGGQWRSRDGRVWERRHNGRWLPPTSAANQGATR